MSATLRVALIVFAWALWSPWAAAQDRVVGRVHVVGVEGDVHRIEPEGKILPLQAGESFLARLVQLEAAPTAKASVVLSNNTGLAIDSGTRLEITRFEQAPFVADPGRPDDEPSVSMLEGSVFSGSFAVCLPNQVFGSIVRLAIPGGVTANVRGKRVVVDATDARTILYVVDGMVTLLAKPSDQTGTAVSTGQQVTIVPGVGDAFPGLAVAPLDPAVSGRLNEMLAEACLARRAVFFAAPDDPRRPLPPPDGNPTPTVSIDRLGG